MKLRILNLAAAMVAVLYITSSCQKDPVQDNVAGQEQKQTAVASLTQGMETIKFSDGTSTTGKWVNGTFLDEAQLKDLTNLENNPTSKMRTSKSWSNRISLCKKPFRNRKKIIYVDASELLSHNDRNKRGFRHFEHYFRNAVVSAAYTINGIGKLGIQFLPIFNKPRTWGDRMHTIKITTHKYKAGVPVFFKYPSKGRVGNVVSLNMWYIPINRAAHHYYRESLTDTHWSINYFRNFRSFGDNVSIYRGRSRSIRFAKKLSNYMIQGLLGSIGFQHADYKTYKSCRRYKNNIRKHRNDLNNGYRIKNIRPFPKHTPWRVKRRYNGYYTKSIMTACDPRDLNDREERLIIRRTYPAWRANACKNVRYW